MKVKLLKDAIVGDAVRLAGEIVEVEAGKGSLLIGAGAAIVPPAAPPVVAPESPDKKKEKTK